MLDLDQCRLRIERICEEAERGYTQVPMKTALAELVHPFRQALDEMESKAIRWLTLEEVMIRTGWTRKYFDKKLASLGGRSRLEEWAESGHAVKAPPGIWLISPMRIPSPKVGYAPPANDNASTPDRIGLAAPRTGAALDPQVIAEQLITWER